MELKVTSLDGKSAGSVELSDEIFRAPILNALARSRYQALPGEQGLRPGCRSFLFRLEPLAGDASVVD